MKILFFIDSLGSGGAQRQIVELAKVFKENNHTCEFLIYYNILFFKEELDEYNIKINLIDTPSYYKRVKQCRSFIRKGNFDAVISFLDTPNFINELAGLPNKNWKIIVGERSANKDFITNKKGKLLRWFHRFSDTIVSNSYANKSIVNELYPQYKNVKVIYNIVDLQKWLPNVLEDRQPKIRIITAATIRDLKNPKVLIEALNLLTPMERKEIKIDWFGKDGEDGTYQDCLKLIDTYNLKDNLQFHAPDKNIHKLFVNYNIVGLYSKLEGLPNVVCEGMAAGKLIISSDVSDVPILLQNQKEFIFESMNPQDLARVLRKIIYDTDTEQIQSIGKLNRKYALENFEKNKIFNAYFNLLN